MENNEFGSSTIFHHLMTWSGRWPKKNKLDFGDGFTTQFLGKIIFFGGNSHWENSFHGWFVEFKKLNTEKKHEKQIGVCLTRRKMHGTQGTPK